MEKRQVTGETGNIVLCGANSYEQKVYFNPQFARLPDSVQDELRAMIVLYTEEVGGILTMEFEPDGTLIFKTMADDYDYLYDEVSSGLKMHQMRKHHRELLESLEVYYRIFFMGEAVPPELLRLMEQESGEEK